MLRVIGAVIVIMLIAGSASAGGLLVPDLGTVAIGRGTAFVARADNLTAFYYNPAGLSKNSGPRLLLSGNLVHMRLEYLRAGGDPAEIDGMTVSNPDMDYSDVSPPNGVFDPVPYESVSLQSNLGPAPMLVFSWGDLLGVEGLAAAAGLIPPSSFGTPDYPEDGPQRYAMQSAHFLMLFPGVGLSYAINRYIQVGGVFLSGMGFFEQSVAIRPAPVLVDPINNNEHAGGDAALKVDVADLFMPTGIFGVLSQPVNWLELGASVKLPIQIEASGRAEYTAPETDLPYSAFVEDREDVVLRQQFPWMVSAGARFVHPRFDVEVDFVWENWSSLEAFEIDMDAELNQDTSIENGAIVEMPDTEIPKRFRDTFSVRVGGDVELWPGHLTVRAGAHYQSSAYSESYSTFGLDFPFGEQIGVGGGLTWHTGRYLDVTAGFLHVFQLDVVVEEGVLQQQGLPYDSGDEGPKNIGNTVNNGRYEVGMNFFGVSLEGHFQGGMQ